MSVDVTALQLRVESSEARTATGDLDRLSDAGLRSERSMAQLATRAAILSGAIAAAGAMYRASTLAARGFETSLSELSAITGATGADLKAMADAARQFGATTTLSASEAAKAFQLVASAKPDLLGNVEALTAVTGAAITLAEATGETLPAAAETLGSALNQFGADAAEADRYINVLAAGSQRGASVVSEVAVALRDAGVVAANAGLSFEETNAAIQTLATAGIKGGQAGTMLRNILLQLDTATDTQLRPSVVGLEQALENLAAQQLDTGQLVEMFGRQNVTAATILLQNRDAVTQMTEALTGTSIAHEQARTRVDNLEGDLKQLNSAWEALLITVGERFTPAQRTAAGEMTNIVAAFDQYLAGADDVADATSKAAFVLQELSVLAFRAGLEFKDLGDILGARAAQLVAIARLDFEGARAIGSARRETRDAMEAEIEAFTDRVRWGRATLDLERSITQQRQAQAEVLQTMAGGGGDGGVTAALGGEPEAILAAVDAHNAALLARLELRYAGEAEAAQMKAEADIEQLMQMTDLTIEEEVRRSALIEAIRTDLADRLSAIEERASAEELGIRRRALTELEKFEAMSASQRTQRVLSEAVRMTQGVAQNSKKMFQLNKAAAIGQAMVDAYSSFNRTMAAYSWPVNVALAGLSLASAMAQVNAIRSTSFSGGGGGTTPSMAGSVPSFNGMAVPDRASELLAQGNQQGARLGDGGGVTRIEIKANGFLTPEMVDDVVAGVKSAITDRDVVLVEPGTRQALELRD